VRAIFALTVAVVSLLLIPLTCAAEDPKPSSDELSLTLGGRFWATTGTSSRNVSAPGFPRLSELRWRGVDALVPEVNFELVWRRLVALITVGGGIINDGVLIDEDFSASGVRTAATRSKVDDSHVFHISTDVGARVFDWAAQHATSRGYIDVLAGFQYWQERYVAFGGTGFPTAVGSDVRAISNDYRWRSIRLGARTQLPVYGGLSVALRGYVIPWSSLEIEDVHYLRSDLRRDPSFRDEANGGIGGQVDAAVRYAITNHLAVEAGFQYWVITSGEGDEFAFATAGTSRQTLKEAKTERYGPFVGVRWRF
jgi:hypothetical protein